METKSIILVVFDLYGKAMLFDVDDGKLMIAGIYDADVKETIQMLYWNVFSQLIV